LGDNDFYEVPIAAMTDSVYLLERMLDFNLQFATSSDSVTAGAIAMLPESEETTHFSVVDDAGNAVSITTTLNGGFGSKTVVGGAGFFLNNEMDDFSAKPGVPNLYGLIGGEANAIEPGKRMLSSMTPTIVMKNGKLFLVVGSPGGSTIITSVFQVFLNIAEFEMTASEAVAAKRFHHQWLPDQIFIEENAFDSLKIRTLESKGHTIKIRGKIGAVEAILVLPDGKLEGAADPRFDDHAEGW
jgi:gamma-glutamyltranspeptidase/glutathione hydrolase